MPPPIFPPTPAPSTDIKGKEALHFPGIDNTFELPPAAVSHHEMYQHKATDMPASPDSSQSSRYQSESMTVSGLTSPPPAPSRSRKTSQPKPKISAPTREEKEDDAAYAPTKATSTTSGRGKAKDASRGKGSAATSAQGRKVARKTAHSIIERRRRSKMNEEFGVLKDLIPACRGLEMHKLAILQASIDYLRHLESNISDLKAGRAQSSEAPSPLDLSHDAEEQEDEVDDEYVDDRMQLDEDDVSPSTEPTSFQPSQSHVQAKTRQPGPATTTAPSPSLNHNEPLHRTSTSSTSASASTTTQPSPYFGPIHSASSTSTFSRPSYSASSTTSPIFGPYLAGSSSRSNSNSVQEPGLGFSTLPPASVYNHNHYHNRNYSISISGSRVESRAGSTQTSPVIVPKDQGLNEAEASTALLMLNKDRRHSSISVSQAGEGKRRGMSVRDLLGS